MPDSELLPSALRKEYEDAIHALNARLWRLTTTQCGVILEALLEEQYPQLRGNLFKKLDQLEEIANHSSPVWQLFDLLRRGRNEGAHFDPTRKPNTATAEAMLQLTEYLLEYIYTLPRLVDRFEEHFNEPGQAD